jgi:hypothetical protein
MSASDVINCSTNVNGVYTINTGGESSTANPTAIPVVEAGSSELPKTGNMGATVGLLVFGIVGVLSSIALRFL